MARMSPGRGKWLSILIAMVALTTAGVGAWRSWPILRLRWYFRPLGRNAQGHREYRHVETGLVFVRLPGGKFAVGSPSTEPMREADEGPLHEVELGPFLIAKYEVDLWAWSAGARRVEFHLGDVVHLEGGDGRPVRGVSWEECLAFRRKTGLDLPTEAQWEYACRASSGGAFPDPGRLDDLGWYRGNSGGICHPPGEKAPNGFGLHDMHGNLWEWCRDDYDPDFYRTSVASARDPVCESGSGPGIVRGGSWESTEWECRSASRHAFVPSYHSDRVGFRPVFTLR